MKSWVLWILASALFLALYDLAKKASVRNNAVLPVLLCSTSFGALAYVVGIALAGRCGAMFSAVDGRVLALGLSKSVIVASSWVFTFCALRTLPITVATPIRASSPALVFLVACFLYGEIPSLLQGLGMALVFAGYWTFSWAGKHEGIDFLHNRAVGFAIAGAVLSAVSSLWDKFVFQVMRSPVEPTQLIFQLGLIAVYALCLLATRILKPLPPPPPPTPTSSSTSTSPSTSTHYAFTWRWTIPLVGILLAFADWLLFNGLAIQGTPVSVAALMRRFSVAITFVLGAFFFRETNLVRKSIALALVLFGIALLCFKS